MAKVELKAPVVAEIAEAVKDAQSVVLVDYRGLTVDQDTALRKQLRAAGVTYKVYKNTMMNFAFKGTDFEALAPYLEGPSAIAISTTDATAPARELANFAKTAEKLEIKGGVVEGNAYDADPWKRSSYFQIAGQHAVPYHQHGSRSESDRRERRRSKLRSSTCRRSTRCRIIFFPKRKLSRRCG